MQVLGSLRIRWVSSERKTNFASEKVVISWSSCIVSIKTFKTSRFSPTVLKTSFSSAFFIPTIKRNAFGSSDYLGSLGGLMGLFAGMSVISVVEAAFFIIRIAFAKLQKLKNRRITHDITFVVPKNLPSSRKPTAFFRFPSFFISFTKKSDIHGLPHIAKKDKSVGDILFWLIAMLTSSAACIYLIFDLIENSTTNPIKYAIDQKLWDVKDVRFF